MPFGRYPIRDHRWRGPQWSDALSVTGPSRIRHALLVCLLAIPGASSLLLRHAIGVVRPTGRRALTLRECVIADTRLHGCAALVNLRMCIKSGHLHEKKQQADDESAHNGLQRKFARTVRASTRTWNPQRLNHAPAAGPDATAAHRSVGQLVRARGPAPHRCRRSPMLDDVGALLCRFRVAWPIRQPPDSIDQRTYVPQRHRRSSFAHQPTEKLAYNRRVDTTRREA
ncbi:hypothetical protein LMG24235_06565 [Paraburkholderia sabiae]|nr:hypothetical protein LMG24235_06565 [Paraburkholderia sabiae]